MSHRYSLPLEYDAPSPPSESAQTSRILSQAPTIAPSFTGPDHIVTLTGVPTTSAATWSVWTRPTKFSALGYILFRKSSFAIALRDGVVLVSFGSTYPGWKWVTTSATLPLGTWSNLVVTYDGDAHECRIYRNGVLLSRCIVKGALSPSADHVRVGTLSFNKERKHRTRLTGEIAQVAMWKVALSHADVVAHWGKRLTGSEPGLISFFPLDEGSGSVGRDVTGRAGAAKVNADWLLQVNLPPPQLSRDLRNMVNNAQCSDIVLRAGIDGKAVYAHRMLLIARCAVFRAMLTGGMRETDSAEITLQGLDEEVLLQLLEFIYTDTVEVRPSSALALMVAADRFQLERLQVLCEDAVAGMLDLDNVCAVFETADALRAHQLRHICFNWIVARFSQVFRTANFTELDPSLQREVKHAASSADCVPSTVS